VSDNVRLKFADVPWQQIVGMRNIIVHAYAELDPEKIWRVIQKDLTPLLARLGPLVDDVEPIG
jgi:uncharacterized protein with HEPN domain